MNKKHIILLILPFLIGMALSCTERDLEGYHTENYIYFSKSSNDTTIFSFAYDSELKEGIVQFKLNMISQIKNKDRRFSVRFIADESTAIEGRDFSYSEQDLIVKANDSIGYFNIHVKKDPTLKGKTVKAIFELSASDDFLPGINKNLRANLLITDKIERPDWWDEWHISSGLGIYSDKKFKLFIEITGQHDLTLIEDGGTLEYLDMRSYVVYFKRWIEENPQTEENGSKMTVPIIG